VTGGLGTSTVSFGGKTYYVCCSGCRDEFNANPKKYVDEFEKNKKK
jgi:YHS domain-containing protein